MTFNQDQVDAPPKPKNFKHIERNSTTPKGIDRGAELCFICNLTPFLSWNTYCIVSNLWLVDNYQLKCKDALKHTYCLEKQKLRELKEEFCSPDYTHDFFRDVGMLREDLKKNGKGNDIGHFSVRPPYPKDIVT